MAGENWMDRALREAEADPKLRERKEMFEKMIKVEKPKRVIPVSEVPEFSDDAFSNGMIQTRVGQGHMGSTEHLPIRTDNAAACNIFLLKEQPKDGVTTFDLIHVWAGNFTLNRPGAQLQDIKERVKNAEAIAITGDMSEPIQYPAKELYRAANVITKKHLQVPSGRKYVSVVFRPDTNELLVRIGSDAEATEVWVYDGF